MKAARCSTIAQSVGILGVRTIDPLIAAPTSIVVLVSHRIDEILFRCITRDQQQDSSHSHEERNAFWKGVQLLQQNLASARKLVYPPMLLCFILF